MSNVNISITQRAAAIIAVSIACLLASACTSKEDKAAADVAAIRAMMEKQEAEKKDARQKDLDAAAADQAKIRASR